MGRGLRLPSRFIMWITTYLLIIFTTIFFIPSNVPDIWWAPKEMMYILFAGGVIGSSWMTDNRRISYKNIWAGIFLIYILAGFCWYYFRPLLFPGEYTIFTVWNIRPTINVILGLVLIKTLVEKTTAYQQWINIAKVLCWMCFGISVFALLQYAGFDQIFGAQKYFFINDKPNRFQLMLTFLGNKHLTANYIAVTAPLCLMFNNYKYKIIFFLAFIVLCLADVTVPFCVFLLTAILYLLFMKKFKLVCAMTLLGIGGLFIMVYFYPTFLNSTGRFALWKSIWTDTLATKLVFTGTGLGSFSGHFKSGTLRVMQAHNEPLQIFREGGIIAIVIVFGYLIDLARRGYLYYKNNKSILFVVYTCAFFSFLLNSTTSFPLRIAPLAVVGILYIASLETQIQGERYV